MMDLDFAKNPVIKNVNVDYTVSMFIDSVIERIDAQGAYVDVKVLVPGEEKNLGGGRLKRTASSVLAVLSGLRMDGT